MSEQIKTSVTNYLLNNPEVDAKTLAQGVADLMQSEIVQIIKKESSQTQADFNINTFLNK